MTTELIDCKERLLKFEEKEKQWEKDAGLWAEKEKDFETKQAELEGAASASYFTFYTIWCRFFVLSYVLGEFEKFRNQWFEEPK